MRHGQPHRDNSFDFLRVVGAMLVFGSHHYALQGRPEPMVGSLTTLGGLGVAIFFSISGYLISISWLRDPHVGRFALRRLARIVPGLAVVVAACAVILGALVTTLPLEEYFQHPGVWQYFRNVVMFPVYSLPGVFESNPYPRAVNGSLWTLPLEFFLYFAILPVIVGVRRATWILPVSALVLAAVGWWWMASGAPARVVWGTDVRYVCLLAPYFCMGSFWALEGVSAQRLSLGKAALGVAAMGVVSGLALYLVAVVVIPYATLAVGLRSIPVVRRIGRWGDFSYGLYIYAFPMQQLTLWWLGPQAGDALLFGASLGLTLACAVLSWHGVEKPMLARKPRPVAGASWGSAAETAAWWQRSLGWIRGRKAVLSVGGGQGKRP